MHAPQCDSRVTQVFQMCSFAAVRGNPPLEYQQSSMCKKCKKIALAQYRDHKRLSGIMSGSVVRTFFFLFVSNCFGLVEDNKSEGCSAGVVDNI